MRCVSLFFLSSTICFFSGKAQAGSVCFTDAEFMEMYDFNKDAIIDRDDIKDFAIKIKTSILIIRINTHH